MENVNQGDLTFPPNLVLSSHYFSLINLLHFWLVDNHSTKLKKPTVAIKSSHQFAVENIQETLLLGLIDKPSEDLCLYAKCCR